MADLKALLDRREDNFLERKPRGVHPRDIRKTVVAFANSLSDRQEGVLLIGVRNDGVVHGVANVDELQKTVRDICTEQCYPSIRFSCEVLEHEGGPVVAVTIPASREKPHFAGPAYVRRASVTEMASKEEYEALLKSRNDKCRVILGWGHQVCTAYGRGKKVGDLIRLNDPSYLEAVECTVESCDEHMLRLLSLNGYHLCEPLRNVTPIYDEKKHRPGLIIEDR